MPDTCRSFNEPDGGTCLVRCAKDEGHDGDHEGAYRIRPDGVRLNRRWSENSPGHRDVEQARQWVDLTPL